MIADQIVSAWSRQSPLTGAKGFGPVASSVPRPAAETWNERLLSFIEDSAPGLPTAQDPDLAYLIIDDTLVLIRRMADIDDHGRASTIAHMLLCPRDSIGPTELLRLWDWPGWATPEHHLSGQLPGVPVSDLRAYAERKSGELEAAARSLPRAIVSQVVTHLLTAPDRPISVWAEGVGGAVLVQAVHDLVANWLVPTITFATQRNTDAFSHDGPMIVLLTRVPPVSMRAPGYRRLMVDARRPFQPSGRLPEIVDDLASTYSRGGALDPYAPDRPIATVEDVESWLSTVYLADGVRGPFPALMARYASAGPGLEQAELNFLASSGTPGRLERYMPGFDDDLVIAALRQWQDLPDHLNGGQLLEREAIRRYFGASPAVRERFRRAMPGLTGSDVRAALRELSVTSTVDAVVDVLAAALQAEADLETLRDAAGAALDAFPRVHVLHQIAERSEADPAVSLLLLTSLAPPFGGDVDCRDYLRSHGYLVTVAERLRRSALAHSDNAMRLILALAEGERLSSVHRCEEMITAFDDCPALLMHALYELGDQTVIAVLDGELRRSYFRKAELPIPTVQANEPPTLALPSRSSSAWDTTEPRRPDPDRLSGRLTPQFREPDGGKSPFQYDDPPISSSASVRIGGSPPATRRPEQRPGPPPAQQQSRHAHPVPETHGNQEIFRPREQRTPHEDYGFDGHFGQPPGTGTHEAAPESKNRRLGCGLLFLLPAGALLAIAWLAARLMNWMA